jgi:hypothetical protein
VPRLSRQLTADAVLDLVLAADIVLDLVRDTARTAARLEDVPPARLDDLVAAW